MSYSSPSRWQVGFVLALGVASISTSAILIRLSFVAAAIQGVGFSGVGFSLVLAASRLAIAAVCFIPVWLTVQQGTLQAHRQLQSQSQTQAQLTRRAGIPYSIAAGIFLAVHFASWMTSLSYTSIAVSVTLVTMNPVWVALIGWIWLKEKPSFQIGLGIAIALLGGGLIAIADTTGTSSASNNPLLGNCLALIGSWTVSLYFLLGREAQRRGLSISSHLVLTNTIAAIALFPLPLLLHTAYLGYPIAVYGYILLMGLFPQLIGHTSFNWAVRWISPTLVTLTILAEPIGASILAFLLFRELPSWGVVLGASVILSGVTIAAIGEQR